MYLEASARGEEMNQAHDVTGMVGLGRYSRERFLARLNSANLSQMSGNLARVLEIVGGLSVATAEKHPPRDVSIRIDDHEITFFGICSPREALLRELNERIERHKLTPRFSLRTGILRLGWAISSSRSADAVLFALMSNALLTGDVTEMEALRVAGLRKVGSASDGKTSVSARLLADKKHSNRTPEFKVERAKYMRWLRENTKARQSGGNNVDRRKKRNKKTKAVIELLRVSTEAQAGEDKAGLAAQRAANRRTAAKFALEIIETIELVDVSGTSVLYAPGYQRLLEMIADPNIDGVVAKEFSRLVRPESWEDGVILQRFVDTGTSCTCRMAP